jgi:tRNA-intron endonuclease
MSISGILSGTKVLVGDPTLKSWLKEKEFGEERGSRHELSLIEALFLIENKKLEVKKGEKTLSFEDLLKIGNKLEKDFYAKFSVFRDLRSRGLLVRTGFKFGSDFRVYERGKKLKGGHSKFLVHVIPEEYECSFPELARAVRVANTVNKKMIFAIVDEEGDISYYLVDRVKM